MLKHSLGASQVARQVKESGCQSRRCRRHGFNFWVGKTPRRRKWLLTPTYLPGQSHGRRSLVGYSPRVAKSQTWLSAYEYENIVWFQLICPWRFRIPISSLSPSSHRFPGTMVSANLRLQSSSSGGFNLDLTGAKWSRWLKEVGQEATGVSQWNSRIMRLFLFIQLGVSILYGKRMNFTFIPIYS